jgi:hypothetical protein
MKEEIIEAVLKKGWPLRGLEDWSLMQGHVQDLAEFNPFNKWILKDRAHEK